MECTGKGQEPGSGWCARPEDPKRWAGRRARRPKGPGASCCRVVREEVAPTSYSGRSAFVDR